MGQPIDMVFAAELIPIVQSGHHLYNSIRHSRRLSHHLSSTAINGNYYLSEVHTAWVLLSSAHAATIHCGCISLV